MTSNATKSQKHKGTAIQLTRQKIPKNIQTIKCRCGTRIMLVPDVKAMSRAVETHLGSHKEKDAVEITVLRDDLIAKIFRKIK